MFFQNARQDKPSLIAKDVFARAAKEDLVLNPPVFSVLYTYYSGNYPEINRRIELREREGNPLTEAFCQDIYDLYLSDNREKRLVQETSQRLQETMGDISEMIASTGLAQREYHQRLQKKTDKLNSDVEPNPEELKTMIKALVEDTKRMMNDNQKLEQKLNESSLEMQEMRDNIESLKREALTDSLTNLSNRKAFDREMKNRTGESLSSGKPLSLLMVDIDHFKQFNDTYGHQVGDQVLRLVANVMQNSVKPYEMVARYGGEEFSVILPGSKLRDAEKIANKIREKIAVKDIFNQAKQENMGHLTISIGAAQYKASEPVTSLIERADRALYKAKELGRNTVVAVEYDAGLHKSLIDGEIVIDVNR
ncbi:MAG TPA: diguanylate cyclase [Alphaproteobacteria bacterium]